MNPLRWSYVKGSRVRPLIKKSGQDPDILKNYRPVPNLPFISKVLEKVVDLQIEEHIVKTQSSWSSPVSIQKASFYLDCVTPCAEIHTSVLVMLDLSAAFDTIDHKTLLDRLDHLYRIAGKPLQWMRSYLSDRFRTVCVDGKRVSPGPQKMGPSAGNISCNITSMLTTISYILPSNLLINQHTMTQFKELKPVWMTLSVGWTKTFRNGDSCVKSSLNVRNLGAIYNTHLDMEHHVNAVSQACYKQIRNILLSKIRQYLTIDATKSLVNSTITTRLDYCNDLLYVPFFNRLQVVQNTAARLITKTPKHAHITPVLKQLHWLPVNRRVEYKVIVHIYKAMNEQITYLF